MYNRTLKWLGLVGCVTLLSVPLAARSRSKSAGSVPSAWPAETLTGTITMVDPGRQLIVVQDASHVPFDIVVTRQTRIHAGEQELTLGALKSDLNRKVSLRFVPEKRGDLARSIDVSQGK